MRFCRPGVDQIAQVCVFVRVDYYTVIIIRLLLHGHYYTVLRGILRRCTEEDSSVSIVLQL